MSQSTTQTSRQGLNEERAANEDRALRAELPGYEAYATQTRYRLVPGVW